MDFHIESEITNIELIATNTSIKDIKKINKKYGKGRWRKLKGIAFVRLLNGNVRKAEIHWYEAHGIGKKLVKVKRFIK